jgi:hypothetical protein
MLFYREFLAHQSMVVNARTVYNTSWALNSITPILLLI